MVVEDRLPMVKIAIVLLIVFGISNEVIGESYCITPPMPENGRYRRGAKLGKPGDRIDDGMSLSYECDTNYHPLPTVLIFCDNGIWSDTVQCIKTCSKIQSSTMTFKCNRLGKSVPCTNHMFDETVLTFTCKERHIPPSRTIKTLTCNNGNWDNPTPYCIPECGEEKMEEEKAMSTNSHDEVKGNSPWHVGIYQYENNDFENICGGTILTNKIIITAAHCFSKDHLGTILPKESFAIGVGKYYRSWNHTEDEKFPHVQHLYIEEILTTGRYGGVEFNYQHDIALVVVKTEIKFYDSVHPICYDLLSTPFQLQQTANGTLGKVAGWSVMESASENLKTLNVSIIEYNQCRRTIPQYLRPYLLTDKICAGWLNDTNECNGYAGDGLVVDSMDKGIRRWYIRGIVSLSDFDDTGSTCRKGVYSIFTNIFSHKDFILEAINKYK